MSGKRSKRLETEVPYDPVTWERVQQIGLPVRIARYDDGELVIVITRKQSTRPIATGDTP